MPPFLFPLSFSFLSSSSFFLFTPSAPTFYNGYNDTFTSQITTCRDCQALAQNPVTEREPFKSKKIKKGKKKKALKAKLILS